MKKIFKYFGMSLVLLFAFLGLGLSAIFASTFFHFTDLKGRKDLSSFSGETLGVSTINTSIPLHQTLTKKVQSFCYINTVASFGSDNANKIYNSYIDLNSDILLNRMVNAVSIRLKDNQN